MRNHRHTIVCTVFAFVSMIAALAIPCNSHADNSAVLGTWSGHLNVPGGSLPLVIHVSESDAGGISVTLDSPDQGAFGLETSDATFVDGQLEFTVPVVAGKYVATLSEDGEKLTGIWSQGGREFPELILTKGEPKAPERPQTPKAPFPYEVEEVSFENIEAGITLAGTLTLPRGEGPFPAVVLVSGSGPQDRDETIMDHKPFHVLADHLSRNGIVVLRFDDRGVGDSGGNFATATTFDFGKDGGAGAAYLATRKEVDGQAIGFIGHSEGGMIAPRVSLESKEIGFVVSIAGVAVQGRELMLEQTGLIARGGGLTESLVQDLVNINGDLYDIACDADSAVPLADRVAAYLDAKREELGSARASMIGFVEARDAAIAATLDTQWFREFVTYDPRPDLKNMKVPMLAIFGELDLQVPPSSNAPAVRTAYPAADVVIFPALNHLMQHAETGMLDEYAKIEETMADEVLEKITSWIKDVTR